MVRPQLHSDIPKLGRTVPLKEMSAREIKQLADKITKTKIGISSLSKSDYLEFFKEFFQLAYAHSSQRFHPGFVSQMQKNRILGVVRRTLIIARK